MGASTRKDYGSDAIVAENNETMKQVNTVNSPYSVQATGHDKVKANYIPVTSENLDALADNTRVLLGNKEGYVKSTLLSTGDTAPPLVSAVITVLDKTKTEIDTSYTKAELLALGNLFLVSP